MITFLNEFTSMKKLLALLLLFIGIQTFSQKQANIWYFGQGAGVDFNFSPPRALTDGHIIHLRRMFNIF